MNRIAVLIGALAASLAFTITASADGVRELALQSNDLVYDGVSQRIYASVPTANSIVVIDPLTGVIEDSTWVGSEPTKMDISDDGAFIYVGLDGAGAVRRYDVATRSADLEFSLGRDRFLGPMFADDLKVLPGSPTSVAVARRNRGFSPRHMGVAIYDEGVMRSVTTPGHTGSNVITISDIRDRLYGYNNETTEFGFRRMAVDASGVTVLDSTPNLIQGFGVDIRYDAGRVYATSGLVVDAEERTLVGTFSGVGSGALVAPDSSVNRAFFLTGSGATRQLLAYDATTFVRVGAMDIPGVSGFAHSLIRWGSDGLAFRTTGGQVFIVQTSLVPPPAPAARP